MRRSTLLGIVATLFGASLAVSATAIAQQMGVPARVVDFEPDSIALKNYPMTDYAAGTRQGSTQWRVVRGTGNAAEVWTTTTKEGRLLDLGGRYINYSDDRGKTWKSVRPLEELVNAEGAVVVAPNNDILGVTWDPYSGDRVITYKYDAKADQWLYNYDPLHTPFWDRPGLVVVPGPFDTPLGSVPYITFIHGLPHDPWYYSTDGLNYVYLSSQRADTSLTSPIKDWLEPKAHPTNDWIQPNMYFPSTPLGKGRALFMNGANLTMFSPEDMRWHRFQLPKGTVPGSVQVDSRGRLHALTGISGKIVYQISADDGRTWKSLEIPGATAGDFHANAAAGVAALWALKDKQDLVYKIDITGNQPKLIRRYMVGKGDDCRCGTLGTYGLTGGHRFDFSSLSIFPDGRIAVSFMDSATTLAFPTLGTEVVAPALAIELDTILRD